MAPLTSRTVSSLSMTSSSLLTNSQSFRPHAPTCFCAPCRSPSRGLATLAEEQNTAEQPARISITFVDLEGNRAMFDGVVGETILETCHRHGIPLVGACEGGGNVNDDVTFGEGPSCDFCHVEVMQWDKLPAPRFDEEDMLDNMDEPRTKNSRLGCQVTLTEEMDNLVVMLPQQRDPDIGV